MKSDLDWTTVHPSYIKDEEDDGNWIINDDYFVP
jgi:hypothetical protein